MENRKRFIFSVACITLLKKEIHRFFAVAGQTITAPLISASLYLFIFGISLGSKISMGVKVSYLEFIIPGLVMMATLNNSYQNVSSSIVNAKYHGNIKDILIAPINYAEMIVAYVLAAMTRGLIVGGLVFILSCFFKFPSIANPLFCILIAIMGSITFAILGMITGICSQGWEQLSVWSNFILMPLTYLGGVFYTIKILPPFWQKISCLNPLLYIIDAFRYGFLGQSDISPLTSIAVISSSIIILFIICAMLLKSGYKLKE